MNGGNDPLKSGALFRLDQRSVDRIRFRPPSKSAQAKTGPKSVTQGGLTSELHRQVQAKFDALYRSTPNPLAALMIGGSGDGISGHRSSVGVINSNLSRLTQQQQQNCRQDQLQQQKHQRQQEGNTRSTPVVTHDRSGGGSNSGNSITSRSGSDSGNDSGSNSQSICNLNKASPSTLTTSLPLSTLPKHPPAHDSRSIPSPQVSTSSAPPANRPAVPAATTTVHLLAPPSLAAPVPSSSSSSSRDEHSDHPEHPLQPNTHSQPSSTHKKKKRMSVENLSTTLGNSQPSPLPLAASSQQNEIPITSPPVANVMSTGNKSFRRAKNTQASHSQAKVGLTPGSDETTTTTTSNKNKNKSSNIISDSSDSSLSEGPESSDINGSGSGSGGCSRAIGSSSSVDNTVATGSSSTQKKKKRLSVQNLSSHVGSVLSPTSPSEPASRRGDSSSSSSSSSSRSNSTNSSGNGSVTSVAEKVPSSKKKKPRQHEQSKQQREASHQHEAEQESVALNKLSLVQKTTDDNSSKPSANTRRKKTKIENNPNTSPVAESTTPRIDHDPVVDTTGQPKRGKSSRTRSASDEGSSGLNRETNPPQAPSPTPTRKESLKRMLMFCWRVCPPLLLLRIHLLAK